MVWKEENSPAPLIFSEAGRNVGINIVRTQKVGNYSLLFMAQEKWKSTDRKKQLCYKCGKGIENGTLTCTKNIFLGGGETYAINVLCQM